jgi:hypothetical protein
MTALAVALALALQPAPSNPALAARISQLLHTVFTSNDDNEQQAAGEEARQIFRDRGLVTIAEVGDEAAYGFVVLTCASGVPGLAWSGWHSIRAW